MESKLFFLTVAHLGPKDMDLLLPNNPVHSAAPGPAPAAPAGPPPASTPATPRTWGVVYGGVGGMADVKHMFMEILAPPPKATPP